MVLKNFAEQRPKRFTEECALVSVFINLTQINPEWLLNYISPPGGAWQEFYVYRDGEKLKFYIGRDARRVDLVLQKELELVLFFIAEAKETFKNILSDRDIIQKNMAFMYQSILNFKIKGEYLFPDSERIQPIFAFIVGIDTSKLDKFTEDVVNSEVTLIEKSIDRLPKIMGGRMCVIAYWEKNKTKFRLVFSKQFDNKLQDYFKDIFKPTDI